MQAGLALSRPALLRSTHTELFTKWRQDPHYPHQQKAQASLSCHGLEGAVLSPGSACALLSLLVPSVGVALGFSSFCYTATSKSHSPWHLFWMTP